MTTKTKRREEMHIPDEALHLATDRQITNGLRGRGHGVKAGRNMMIATHKDTGSIVTWQPSESCEPHPLGYRAMIIRALVRFGFFLVLALIVIHFAGLL